jgi:hypothetical protein
MLASRAYWFGSTMVGQALTNRARLTATTAAFMSTTRTPLTIALRYVSEDALEALVWCEVKKVLCDPTLSWLS